jgi:hypothetical protein
MNEQEDMQNVSLDNEERRLLNEYRHVRQSGFGEITAKVHRGRPVAIYTTYKWHGEETGRLREVGPNED